MLAPGTSVGRYLVHRKLAEGGMAEIYLAAAVGAEGFSKEVVIKVVREYLAQDQQFVQLFIAEAHLASRLNHANVVQIFDFGKHDETYYLAMEFIRGASLWDLRKRCREFGVPFPPILAAEIGVQVARGLQYAHSLSEAGQKLGVVHRDVTPHNVLLSFDGAVKLTDFGIAKATTSQTAPGMLKGKFAYMSPEQARGEKVDARTDIFALGVVLWELLTGGRLFDGESDVAVLRSVNETVIAPPIRLNPDVLPGLSEIVMKALNRKLEERFQTAAELERALANFVLRHAESMDDTAVGPFVQQMFREEYAQLHGDSGELPMGDGFGVGHTRFIDRGLRKIEPTMTSTPARPMPVNATPKPVPSIGVMDDPASPPDRTEDMNALPADRGVRTPSGKVPQRTEDMRALSGKLPKTEPIGEAVSRASTEQQPPHRQGPPSRRFDPLPLDSSVVEGSITAPPREPESVTAKEPALPVKSKAPWVVVGGLALIAVAAVAYSQRPAEEAPSKTPEPEVVSRSAQEPPSSVVVEPTPGVVDAGAPAEAAEPKAPEPVAAAPVVIEKPIAVPKPKLGSLKVKAQPFGLVSIDGRADVEVTGQRVVPIAAGDHNVSIHRGTTRKMYKVRIKPNEQQEIDFEEPVKTP